MKHPLASLSGILLAALLLPACGSTGQKFDHDLQSARLLGGATGHNIAAQSIRPVDLPNANGLTGQSGVRAVSAIARLNSGEARELSDVSSSGVSSTVSE